MREGPAQHEWLATYDRLLYSPAPMQRVAILRRNIDLLPLALQKGPVPLPPDPVMSSSYRSPASRRDHPRRKICFLRA
jgi:hypothetical protein